MEQRNLEEYLFALSEDERLIRDTTRDFIERRFKKLGEEMRLVHHYDPELLQRVFAELRNAGFPAWGIPEAYDGIPCSTKALAILTEELCAVDASGPLGMGVTASLFTLPIEMFGSDEQKQKYLPGVACGDISGCYCQTTPDAGSDVGGIDTIAEWDGNYWWISGTKRFITNGDSANVALVLAHTTREGRKALFGDERRHEDLAMFIVDMDRARREKQVTIIRNERKAGMHGTPATEIAFDRCRVDDILGSVGDGWKIAMVTLASSRASAIAAQSVGILRGAYEIARDYVEKRQAFGMKLADLPITRESLQWIRTLLEMGRLLSWRASYYRDREPNDQRTWEVEASEAKLFATKVAVPGTYEMMENVGGAGYMLEAGIAKFWHDSGLPPIYEGPSRIQQLIIIRDVLRHRIKKSIGRSSLKQLIWKLRKDWLLSHKEEEALFLKRAQTTHQQAVIRSLLSLRKELIALIQEAFHRAPPSPTSPTLPSPWFHIASAISACEGAKLLLWKQMYLEARGGNGEEQDDWLCAKAGLQEAKRAVANARIALEVVFK